MAPGDEKRMMEWFDRRVDQLESKVDAVGAEIARMREERAACEIRSIRELGELRGAVEVANQKASGAYVQIKKMENGGGSTATWIGVIVAWVMGIGAIVATWIKSSGGKP